MTAAELIGLGALGGVGAVARLGLDGSVSARLARAFPYGTLAVNLVGSLMLGVMVGAALRGEAAELLETGLVGAFTTFSTWMLESHRLSEERRYGPAALNLAGSLVLGVAAAWAGQHLGAVL